MEEMKIMTQQPENKKAAIVFGTRPEFIKLAPVIDQLSNMNQLNRNQVDLISSGQHLNLLEDAQSTFQIKIDFDLKLMTENQTSISFFTRAIEAFTELFSQQGYRIVVVHGDTGTATAAALAAHHNKIPVAHVEAGLRSKDIWAPWPEESNRRIIDAISSLHFAPTEQSAQNLYGEGHRISTHITGNTVVDAAIQTLERITDGSINPSSELKNLMNRITEPIILVTQHRRENFGDPLLNILFEIKKLATQNIHMVFPVHPNPNVSKIIKEQLSEFSNISLISPLKYHDMIYLISRSRLIITDSGGLQEEGTSLGIPVLVTREKTERPEGLIAGSIHLVGANGEKILEKSIQILSSIKNNMSTPLVTNPYGDGQASKRICKILEEYIFGEPLQGLD
jgi:UDP-N-acetylglucosamine 2-epimerase (non-hydrolysing)